MKAYVTGNKGFIAGYLMPYLLAHGDTIVGYNDIREPVQIPEGTDVVYHLGALTRPKESQVQRLEYFEANVAGTLEILDETVRCAPKAKVVLFSSATQDHLDSWYGYTKRMAELACEAYTKFDGLSVYRMRLFGTTGVGHHGDAINDFAAQAATLGRIRHGNLDYFRDISDVRDVVPTIVHAVNEKGPGVHYIGRGEATHIKAVAEWFEVPLEFDDSKVRVEDKIHVSPVASVKGRPLEETLDWVHKWWIGGEDGS